MDDASQARAYADEDFSEARELFLDHFASLHPAGFTGSALDLGCGPADIPIALLARYPDSRFDAVDGAEAMLHHARQAIDERPAMAGRIRLICDYLPTEKLERAGYDAVVSNSLLHHLRDPAVLWQTARECGKPGASLCVMDLMRPSHETAVDELVSSYAGGAPEVLRRDFRNSLFAAYSPDEVRDQLDAAGLATIEVKAISDRHLLATGKLPG